MLKQLLIIALLNVAMISSVYSQKGDSTSYKLVEEISFGINNLNDKIAPQASVYIGGKRKFHELGVDIFYSSRNTNEADLGLIYSNLNSPYYALTIFSLVYRYNLYKNNKFSFTPQIAVGYGEGALQNHLTNSGKLIYNISTLQSNGYFTYKLGFNSYIGEYITVGVNYRFMFSNNNTQLYSDFKNNGLTLSIGLRLH